MPKTERPHGFHGRSRTRPIRWRIALLLAIPLVSLMTLWAFSTATTLSAALQRRDSATIFDRIATPVGGVLAAIEQERAAATVALAAPSSGNVARFQGLTVKTDAAVA